MQKTNRKRQVMPVMSCRKQELADYSAPLRKKEQNFRNKEGSLTSNEQLACRILVFSYYY